MKFKNYCVVIMGDTKNVLSEIEKISDTKPNVLDAKGILISTFTSFVDIKEITEWFTLNNRSFLVFDLDQNSSGVNIIKKEIHEGLFGFLNVINDEELDIKTFEFLNTINKTNINDTKKNEDEISSYEDEISKLTEGEKDELMNKIIETGVENLTDKDKKILSLLVK
jgi:hypothetical protein